MVVVKDPLFCRDDNDANDDVDDADDKNGEEISMEVSFFELGLLVFIISLVGSMFSLLLLVKILLFIFKILKSKFNI